MRLYDCEYPGLNGLQKKLRKKYAHCVRADKARLLSDDEVNELKAHVQAIIDKRKIIPFVGMRRAVV